MAPAQPLTNMGLVSQPHSSTKVATNKDNRSVLENSDEKGLRCMSKCEDAILSMEAYLEKHTKAPVGIEDVEVELAECMNTSDIRLGEDEDPEATEYSSSFGDTVSGTENRSGFSEAEVESQFYGDNGLTSAFDAFGSMFQMRKKKLTNHWRSFIRPLMWRCKWTELRIKEIESQALQYARELAVCDQEKPLEVDQCTVESFGLKSLPFSSQCHRRKAMKRRKRRRVEDTSDITSYMSHHNLFSYLENKRSDPDGTSMPDDFSNPVVTDQNASGNDEFGINDDQSFLEFRDGDNSLEQILWKIDIVHTRVHRLRNQLDAVMSQNAGRFSSSENLSLLAPCDAQTSSAHSPTFSAGNGDTISVGAIYTPTRHSTEFELGDLVMPNSAVSSYGEAIPIPDIIESTVGLLSAADVTLHQPHIGDSCEDIVDNILIHNEAAEVEGNSCRKISNQSVEKYQETKRGEQEESTNPPPLPVPEPDPVAKTVVPQEQSALKSSLVSEFHIPKNKRKRGERKAGSGGWSRRQSGEPDSQ
ncbi:hypothetical protein L1049_016196 [Liquidambar formosana]|uniref:Uncharacterized protein n=1 Tax=Liquidambar formosana TaxID=63359 RepID=A0AAP0X2Z6_LIQFO